MNTVTSADGTPIAYERRGSGPALIMVDGAMCTRWTGSKPAFADALGTRLSTYVYDRRGRGDSGDSVPYDVEREVEDIAALVDDAGGSAALYGHSSGAALALRAAVALGPARVTGLILDEAPYNEEPAAVDAWRAYLATLDAALADGRNGDAVAAFMQLVGMPAEQVEGMRTQPFWAGMEAVAPSLAYDHGGAMGHDGLLPRALAGQVRVPTLVLYGTASFPFMRTTAEAFGAAIAGARVEALDGQTHDVDPAVTAPVLLEFLVGARLAS